MSTIEYRGWATSYSRLHREEQLRKLAVARSWLASQGLLRKSVKEGTRILDVGCGTGLSEEAFPGVQVVGIDPESALLKQARIPKVLGIAEALPFQDDSFDVTMSLTVLHHTKDPRAALEEMKRVAKKAVVISVLRRAKAFDQLERLINLILPVSAVVDDPKDRIYCCVL